MTTYMCPVCGFPDLEDEPYTEDGTPSYEICECCGFQFGYQEGGERAHTDWRQRWITNGTVWPASRAWSRAAMFDATAVSVK